MIGALVPPVVEIDAALIPVLIMADEERKGLALIGPLGKRLLFYDRADQLALRLERSLVTAVVTETRDTDGFPVPAAIRKWVERNPRALVVVWTAGAETALREILDLAAAGADVRLALRWRDDLGVVLDRLLTPAIRPPAGAVPFLLRGIVLGAPWAIQPELTLAAFHAWPHPSVRAWADSLHITRQALNARLAAAHYARASTVMDCFSAAEIAIRCIRGDKLKQVAAAMGRLDDRSLRRRLARLGCRREGLQDEADFRALIPRVADAIRR